MQASEPSTATIAVAAIIWPQWSSACQPVSPSVFDTQRLAPSKSPLSGPLTSPMSAVPSLCGGAAPYHGRLSEERTPIAPAIASRTWERKPSVRMGAPYVGSSGRDLQQVNDWHSCERSANEALTSSPRVIDS